MLQRAIAWAIFLSQSQGKANVKLPLASQSATWEWTAQWSPQGKFRDRNWILWPIAWRHGSVSSMEFKYCTLCTVFFSFLGLSKVKTLITQVYLLDFFGRKYLPARKRCILLFGNISIILWFAILISSPMKEWSKTPS